VARPGVQVRQRVDREVELSVHDPIVRRDAAILGKLRHAVRNLAARPALRRQGGKQPTLYVRYRGTGFPLRLHGDKKLPRWRELSPWMKLQIATLVLAEGNYIQFTLRLHDDVRLGLADPARQKDYIRDRIKRRMRSSFGAHTPDFLFVVEDMDKDGGAVRPHAHGSIALLPIDIDKAPRSRRKLQRVAEDQGVEVARLLAGRMTMREELKAAARIGKDSERIASTGVDQSRNLWTRRPTLPLFNQHWVTYAFKNTNRFSGTLGDRRIAMSQPLITRAKQLWEIIRLGEEAIP
jgi:hypothetical protein